jgi:hypothetical protein
MSRTKLLKQGEQSMLYPVLMKTIERGEYDAEALQENLDSLFAAGRLTAEQYEKLAGMIVENEQHQEESESEPRGQSDN